MRRFRVHHDGTDLRMKQGTELLAAKDGVVVEASANGYRYNWIAIDHEEGYQAHYGHVTKLLVKAGDIVKQGQVIGLSGGTKGTLGVGFSTGPHLHFELRHHGKLIDPSTVFGTIFAEAFDENYTRY
jgi:murein DD-endopeptidase MepM/ murein hydrolase activator NlpD